jgi:hypothetical protein
VKNLNPNLKRWRNQPKIYSKAENEQIFSFHSPEIQKEYKSSENIEQLVGENEELKKQKEALILENQRMEKKQRIKDINFKAKESSFD